MGISRCIVEDMPRYYLKNPKSNSELLGQRGQSWDEPIYKGQDSNDFYILKWGTDFKRWLFPFDPRTGRITGQPSLVDDDWTGEPQVIGIDEDLWRDLDTRAQHEAGASRLLDQLRNDLKEGDTIRLTREGKTTGYLRAEQREGQWEVFRV